MEKIPIVVRMNEVKALSDEMRVLILELLTRKPMSVHEIAEELKRRGIYKNINTIRYHIQVLKDAGLIELVATEEVRGGVLKYYAARKKVYPVEVPPDIEVKLKPVIDNIYGELKDLVFRLLRENRGIILETAKSLKPCPYCITKHFVEYVILEAFRYALGRAINDPDIRLELDKFESEEESFHL